MVNYEQVIAADPKKMGKVKGWCLQNTRLAFGIKVGHYASAKADMLAQKKAGTLHPLSDLPKDLSVPVYIDTTSSNEHVELYYKGTWYSDGKKVKAPNAASVFGWGECCDGVRVVQKAAVNKFLPAKGYWGLGDVDKRIGKLSEFMYKTFPKYTSKKALGNTYGKYLVASIKEFQKRTHLYPDGCTGPKTYEMLKKCGFKG